MQFVDLNPNLTPFQRRYVQFVKRCDEIERKIRYVHAEAKKFNIEITPAGTVESFFKESRDMEAGCSGAYVLETLESKLDLFERQLVDINKYSSKISEEFSSKVEYHHLLMKTKRFLKAGADIQLLEAEAKSGNIVNGDNETGIQMNPLLAGNEVISGDEMIFANISGVVATDDRHRFERMLFRATRGNCYIRFSPLPSKALDCDGKRIKKYCFIIFFKSPALETKIKRICDAFQANRYELPLNRIKEIDARIAANHKEIEDAQMILEKSKEQKFKLCSELALHVEGWLWVVRREKSTYHTLNLFKSDVAGNALLRGKGWILTSQLKKAKIAIRRAHKQMSLPPTGLLETLDGKHPQPPTHFITNKYTVAFQEFVNTYGIPRYKCANPALFTAATFPFLFGVMYGDIGHGSCLALAGLYLILTESKAEARETQGMMRDIYVARYLLFAMGIMGIYCGLIYNDYFSVGLNLFGSSWWFPTYENDQKAQFVVGAYGDADQVYPFGCDPVWKLSSNELLFFNSMKMKMSVILGIIQMTVGIFLKGMDCVYYKDWLGFFTEFMPMILFDLALFGYMVILIFVKWSINWDQRMALGSCNYDNLGNSGACSMQTAVNGTCYSVQGKMCNAATLLNETCPLGYGGTGMGCQPPNLITTLINIALKPGSVEEPMYAGQPGVQTFLLLVAFFCVPWLLAVKPLYLKYTHKPAEHHGSEGHELVNAEEDEDAHAGGGGGHGHGDGEFNFGEIFIHQVIETIEFVLGMVSNTASYLRLWALSLAHTELATVFWEKAMVSAMNTGSPIAVYIGYAVFACVTFGVLLAMDVLECFLHALRLHWVEFQSKFFKADGYRFVPFEFKAILEGSILE